MQFTDNAFQARTVYGPKPRFGLYTILTWTAQSVNCHIALKAKFYLLNVIIHYCVFVIMKTSVRIIRIIYHMRRYTTLLGVGSY